MNSISGRSHVVGETVRTTKHWTAISYGQTGYSQMRGLRPSERVSIGVIHKLPNTKRKRAATLIRICLQLFFRKTAYPRRIRMGALSSSLNGFRVLMYLPDWAINVQYQKSSQQPRLAVMSESTCSRRVLTKFGLQGGSVSAIRIIGLLPRPLNQVLWLCYYHDPTGSGWRVSPKSLYVRHPLFTNWLTTGRIIFHAQGEVVRELD